jgi:uncharacterized membrane protein YhaH (DUF805 family)
MTTMDAVEPVSLADRKMPPVAQIIMASMACVITSGIYLASHLPHSAPLGPVAALLIAAGVLFLAAAVAVSRLHDFNWQVFYRVIGWAFLAYIAITGILEFVFVFDHTRGTMLLVFTLSLMIFALDIPLLLGFSVARYQEPKPAN